jgi:hypothetical protein
MELFLVYRPRRSGLALTFRFDIGGYFVSYANLLVIYRKAFGL